MLLTGKEAGPMGIRMAINRLVGRGGMPGLGLGKRMSKADGAKLCYLLRPGKVQLESSRPKFPKP